MSPMISAAISKIKVSADAVVAGNSANQPTNLLAHLSRFDPPTYPGAPMTKIKNASFVTVF